MSQKMESPKSSPRQRDYYGNPIDQQPLGTAPLEKALKIATAVGLILLAIAACLRFT
jgi:hypothetical protein